jgi:hypothetical protein
MRRPTDPSRMTPGERLLELGALVLAGYRRLRARQPNLGSELATSRTNEPSCDRAVNRREKGVA